jgi:hypothetical protein
MPTPPPPGTAAAQSWLGTWSRPPDRPAEVAVAVAVLLLGVAFVPGGPKWVASVLDFASLGDAARRRRFLTVAGFVAAFLSLGYIAFYLRGGPRAAEAATYWVQGHAMSHGDVSWTAPDPTASFRARYLVFEDGSRLAGMFPPGYPLLLAAGFLVGAPMLVGPLLAAALVVATWMLAREVALASGEADPRAEWIARIAAGLSIVSAALRYHTSDTMPHGAAAVAVAGALALVMRARRTGDARFFALAGLAVGFLVAARPLSAAIVGAMVLGMAAGAAPSARVRAVAWTLLAALPGVVLLLAANRAATGHALSWPEGAYFAGADGPPGCHRYGFGAGIACDVDDAALSGRTLSGGFGVGAAMLVTLQRLRAHLLDVANLEPLALLALVPALRGAPRERRPAIVLLLVVVGQIAVRFPFYLAGVEPGSGARLLIDVVPLEHALMALAVVRLAPQAIASAAAATMALALAGFGVHASFEHEKLAAGGMGRPRYEPDVAREANVTYGLLFFEDDEGYELASDPGVLASHGVQAVRARGDDHDRLLYDSLGHPPIHKYTLAATGASVAFWSPPGAGGDTRRFEAESDWPPVSQLSGWAEPVTVGTCSSDSRALEVRPVAGAEAVVTIELPVPRGPTAPEKKTWQVIPRIVQRGGPGAGTLDVVAAPGGESLAHWAWVDTATANAGKPPADTCTELPPQPVELGGDRTKAWMVLRAKGGPTFFDKTTLRPK